MVVILRRMGSTYNLRRGGLDTSINIPAKQTTDERASGDGMGVRFAIAGWAACAPGLERPAAWQAWAAAPVRPQGALPAKLEAMPALQRRRLNGLGRAAAQAAWDVHAPATDVPVVFASRYGDAERCLQLLQQFAASGSASPTDFTFSVHNAVGAMYSIARGDQAAYSSIAAGAGTAAAGVVEACALLADGAPQVLLVCYHAPLPQAWSGFDREPACAYAWAWRVVAAIPGQPHFELAWSRDDGEDEGAPGDLPFGLEVLRFALADAAAADLRADGTRWHWSRHG